MRAAKVAPEHVGDGVALVVQLVPRKQAHVKRRNPRQHAQLRAENVWAPDVGVARDAHEQGAPHEPRHDGRGHVEEEGDREAHAMGGAFLARAAEKQRAPYFLPYIRVAQIETSSEMSEKKPGVGAPRKALGIKRLPKKYKALYDVRNLFHAKKFDHTYVQELSTFTSFKEECSSLLRNSKVMKDLADDSTELLELANKIQENVGLFSKMMDEKKEQLKKFAELQEFSTKNLDDVIFSISACLQREGHLDQETMDNILDNTHALRDAFACFVRKLEQVIAKYSV